MFSKVVSIGNYTIYYYGICLTIAIIASYFSNEYRLKKHGLRDELALPTYAAAVISGFIGAKALYIIVELVKGESTLKELLSEGFTTGLVIYGGIIVAIPMVILVLKLNKVDILQYIDVEIASIALAQSIGRLGCSLYGCCYGIEYDGPLRTYRPINIATYGEAFVGLFPVQILSAILDWMNFLLLCHVCKHSKIKGMSLSSYLMTYGVGRFLIEYLRGDSERGKIWIFSTSQVISIAMFVIGLILTFVFIHKYKVDNNITSKKFFRRNKKVEVEKKVMKIDPTHKPRKAK
jgi:phosphatidylglycerol:prolipoprotein diacylglycerol transferase